MRAMAWSRGTSGAASRVLAASVLVLGAVAPGVARACAVCSLLGNENVRLAFFNTTIFLSLLPLALLGLALLWLKRRLKGPLADEFRESDEDAPAPVPETGPHG